MVSATAPPTSRNRRRIIAGGLAASALGLARKVTGAAGQPLRIGVSLGLTGTYAEPSTMQRRGYELWRDDMNARGGILGRSIALDIRDDRSDANESRAIYRDFSRSGTVDHVFGPYSSEITAAVAPVVDAADFPMLAAGASADDIWQRGYKGVFGMWTPASRYTQGMLRLARANGLTTVALLNSDDAFSREVAAGTVKWAPYLHLAVVHRQEVEKSRADLQPGIRMAMHQKADLIMIAGHLAEAIQARRALADAAWEPRAFYATVGPALPDWPTHVGVAMDMTFTTSIWEPNDSFPRSWDFQAAFAKRHGIPPSYHAATAYAAGDILSQAIGLAGTDARNEVRSALFALDTYSVLGRFAVDRTGIQVKRLDMLVQWQGGNKQIVWPDEVRSAAPVIGR